MGEEPPGGPWQAPCRVVWGSTYVVLGGVPPLLHVHHGGILHAVGEHLPPQSEWRPPAASPFHSVRAPAPSLASTVPGATRHFGPVRRFPGSGAHVYRTGRGGPGGHAGSVRPGRLPLGLPRSPSLPRRRRSPARSPARSLRRPVGPAGTGGAEEGRGCVPPARALGGDPGACCQRAGEGQAEPLRGASALGGSALAETVGAGGGGRAGRPEKEREGRGERGSARGGAPGPGEGRRGGGCSLGGQARAGQRAPTDPRAQSVAWRSPGLLRGAQKLWVASERVKGREGWSWELKPACPHPGSSSWSRFGFFVHTFTCPLTPIPQIYLMKSSLSPCCYCPGCPRKRGHAEWRRGWY